MAAQNSASRVYSNIEPHFEWVEGRDLNTLVMNVSGFEKEELKAQVDTSKNLKVSGERNIKGNKWCRFQKSFQLPKDSEISKIRAKFDNGVLYVMVPKPFVMEQTSSQNDNTTAAATTSTGEQQSDESEGNSFKENNEGPVLVPVRGVVRKLLKQKLVILNVVIVAILLALVLFRRYKLADGDNIGDQMDSTAPY